jgi:hypothetical protein
MHKLWLGALVRSCLGLPSEHAVCTDGHSPGCRCADTQAHGVSHPVWPRTEENFTYGGAIRAPRLIGKSGEPTVTGLHGYVPEVTQEHLEASAVSLNQLCNLATTAPIGPEDFVLEVRVGHYDHGAFLALALNGFALLDTTSDGRLMPVGGKSSVRYAIIVNRSVEDQISQTLTFLASLVARQSVTRRIRSGESSIDQIDRRVAEVDAQAAEALTDQLRTEHWREVAKAIAQRARAAGFGLRVKFENPLFDGDAIRRRVPVLRYVYNSVEPLRRSIDRNISGISRAFYLEGGSNIPAAEFARLRDLLDVGQMRRYLAHLLRDAFVCGNGYLAMDAAGGSRPTLRLLPPESVKILGPDKFGVLTETQSTVIPVRERVLHVRGAHQVSSDYGASLLEPFIILAGQRDVLGLGIKEAEQFPPSSRRDSWLDESRGLQQRAAVDRARQIETLLGSSTTRFSAPPIDLYFPGLEEMKPSVSSLRFLDDADELP